MKKSVAAFLAFMLILFCFAAPESRASLSKNAVYVALGDSIAAGYAVAAGEGYPEQLSALIGGVELYNLASSGDDTADLLAKLCTDTYKSALACADIVTISIGGNNLLGPLGDHLRTALPGFNLEQLSSDSVDELFPAFISAMSSPELQKALNSGISSFAADLPLIIAAVKELAPDAAVYVNTVYNPGTLSNSAVISYIDSFLAGINNVINSAGEQGLFTVVDAYSHFKAVMEGGSSAALMQSALDPHPTAYGHSLLAALHYSAIMRTGALTVPPAEGASLWAVLRAESLIARGAVRPELQRLYQTPITRAEFTTLIIDMYTAYSLADADALDMVLSGIPAPDFADMVGHRYEREVSVAYKLKIIGGTSESSFDPEYGLTREAAAKIACALLMLTDDLDTDMALLPEFSDSGEISEWALPYVANAVKFKVLSGRDTGFDPQTVLTREEAMIMVENMITARGWDI